jgi:hypothetical protein
MFLERNLRQSRVHSFQNQTEGRFTRPTCLVIDGVIHPSEVFGRRDGEVSIIVVFLHYTVPLDLVFDVGGFNHGPVRIREE